MKFIEEPVNNYSMAKRKLVCNVGVNDAKYKTNIVVDGVRVQCPFYSRWVSLINRCYSVKAQIANPSYKGCSVCDEWLIFSNFKLWMKNQDWKGKQLDKDLMLRGNKKYCPELCVFITHQVNQLAISHTKRRGKYKLGVGFGGFKNKYTAISSDINGKYKLIGLYGTEDEAHQAYLSHRYQLIKEVADTQPEKIRIAMLKIKV